MLAAFRAVYCFILSYSSCVHCQRISNYTWPLCFSKSEFRSQKVRQSFPCAVLSDSEILMGMSFANSKLPFAISLPKILIFMGNYTPEGSAAAAALRMVCCAQRGACMVVWPVGTNASRVVCLASTRGAYTGAVIVTKVLLCSSLLISYP